MVTDLIVCTCPHCGQQLRIPSQYAGQSGKCNRCGGGLTVPDSATGAAGGGQAPAATEKEVEALASKMRGEGFWATVNSRREAAQALGRTRNPAAVEPLIGALDNKMIRQSAIQALLALRLQPEKTLSALADTLRRTPPEDRETLDELSRAILAFGPMAETVIEAVIEKAYAPCTRSGGLPISLTYDTSWSAVFAPFSQTGKERALGMLAARMNTPGLQIARAWDIRTEVEGLIDEGIDGSQALSPLKEYVEHWSALIADDQRLEEICRRAEAQADYFGVRLPGNAGGIGELKSALRHHQRVQLEYIQELIAKIEKRPQ